MDATLTPQAPERRTAVASVTGEHLYFHRVPAEMYEQLAAVFGEQLPQNPDSTTRWVAIGAGSHVLTFFADND